MGATDASGLGGRPDVLRRVWPADPGVLTDIRDAVRCWLGGVELTADVCEDLVYATSEAASNAVEHAYRAPVVAETVTITMWSEPGMVNIEIVDRGSWVPATDEPTTRGHGLPLIRGMVDSVSIDSRPGGTTVSLRHPTPNLSALQVTARGR